MITTPIVSGEPGQAPTIFDVQQRLGHHSPTLTAAEVHTHLMRERHTTEQQLNENYIAGNN